MATPSHVPAFLDAIPPELRPAGAHLINLLVGQANDEVPSQEVQAFLRACPALTCALESLADQTFTLPSWGEQPIAGWHTSVQQITITGGTIHGSVIGTQVMVALPPRPRIIDLAAAQAQLDALPCDSIPPIGTLPPNSRALLLRPNPLFVGRSEVFMQIAQHHRQPEPRAVAIAGIGGAGKTQLAAEYAHRYGAFFAGGVFWINAADPESVPLEVAACGRSGALDLPGFDQLALPDQLARVMQAWQEPTPRLLIFDNLEDPAVLTRWWPATGGCRVLFTSRRSGWDTTFGVVEITLGELKRGESMQLLDSLCVLTDADRPHADAIAATLGDLPLALYLAGSYLRRYRGDVTLAAYCSQISAPLLLEHPSLQGRALSEQVSPTWHQPHLARTFLISYQQLDPCDPTDAQALALLGTAACLAPGVPIPRALLNRIAEAPDADELLRTDALFRLAELGLLEGSIPHAVRLHRLLAAFVGSQPGATGGHAAAAVLQITKDLNAVGALPPEAEVPHLRHVDAARFAQDLACGRYDEAAQAQIEFDCLLLAWGDARSILARHQALQPNLHDRRLKAKSLINQAAAHNQLGDTAAMAVCYEAALPLIDAQDDPHLASALNGGLGNYDVALGAHDQAIAHYRQAFLLAGGGPKHEPNYSLQTKWMLNIGIIARGLGRIGEAIEALEQADALAQNLADRQLRWLGASVRGLCHTSMGELGRAITLHSEVVSAARDAGDHALLATGLNNLGECFTHQGRHQEAAACLGEALMLWQGLGSIWGESRVTHSQAELLLDQGLAAEACAQARHSLACGQMMRDNDHISYASTVLAEALLAQGQPAAALEVMTPVCQAPSPEQGYHALIVGAVAALAAGQPRLARSWFGDALDAADQLLAHESRLVAPQLFLALARYGRQRCRSGCAAERSLNLLHKVVAATPDQSLARRAARLLNAMPAQVHRRMVHTAGVCDVRTS